MAAEDRFHVKIIIEHKDRPAEIEVKAGNHSKLFFFDMWEHLRSIQNSHTSHRFIGALPWNALAANRREVSYIMRFVPLCRFEVTMYLDRYHRSSPMHLHTDDPDQILPWVSKHGRKIDPSSVGMYVCKGFTQDRLDEYCAASNPEELERIVADLPAILRKMEAHERERHRKKYEAMFVQFTAEPGPTE